MHPEPMEFLRSHVRNVRTETQVIHTFIHSMTKYLKKDLDFFNYFTMRTIVCMMRSLTMQKESSRDYNHENIFIHPDF